MDEEAEVAELDEEVYDEEIDEGEEQAEYPEGEEPEGEGEPEEIPIAFKYDYNGQAVEEDLNYDQITTILAEHKQYQETLKKQNDYIAGVAPVADAILSRPLIAELMRYLVHPDYKGWNDADIMEGVLKVYKGTGSQPEEFATVQDEINYRVQQEIKQKLAPYEQEMQRIKTESEGNKTVEMNMRTLNDALASHGYSSGVLNDDYASKQIMDAINTFNPGFDARKQLLTFNSAKGIINYALKQRKYKEPTNQEKKAMAAPAIKTAKFADIAKVRKEVPKIGSGKASGGAGTKPVQDQARTYARDTDRAKKLQNIFNS